MKSGLCVLTLTTVCLLYVVPQAVGFELKGMSWKGVKPTFTICAKDAPTGAVDRIKEAAAKWKYSKFEFRFAPEKCLDDPSWKKNDGVNYIAFGKLDPGGSDGDTGESFARNELGTDKMVECDIQFSNARKWYVKPTGEPKADESDLLSVAMHEFGHCLGLEHSKKKGAVMEEMLKKGETRRRLDEDDEKGRNTIYGTP